MLVQRGWQPEYLLDMDILSFRALHEGSQRVSASEKVSDAWMSMMASQGTVKGMKKILEPLMKLIDKTGNAGKGNASDFLKKYGGGF